MEKILYSRETYKKVFERHCDEHKKLCAVHEYIVNNLSDVLPRVIYWQEIDKIRHDINRLIDIDNSIMNIIEYMGEKENGNNPSISEQDIIIANKAVSE